MTYVLDQHTVRQQEHNNNKMCAALLRNSIKCINLRINPSALTSRNICASAFCCNWRKSASVDVERKLLNDDNLPNHYQLIYRAPMENYVAWSKNVSTATVSIIGLLAGYQFATTSNMLDMTRQIDISILMSNESDLYYFTVGFVLINLAIRAFVAMYPLRIYKSSDKYVAVYGSQLPFGTIKNYFSRGEIAEYKNVLNPWSHVMFKLGQRSSLLLVDYFKTPVEFQKLFEKNEE
ncbi:uncharacterized protein LOC133843449 isoform X2 [Drosophila sulfurigaster albostrigata]|uniref:uncharacterized protein LOC133843449 isoform X2 n=1 Tax=Drosophila sulfurigaster albostrigata TaxID=89887 RepID=UPI002D21A0CE|nr:uncharacterized protein LOC133843449 isoform X2 [Drosophila sulfurigaster albostrigata]